MHLCGWVSVLVIHCTSQQVAWHTSQVPRVIAANVLHHIVQLTRDFHEIVDLSIACRALALAVDPRLRAVVRDVTVQRVVHPRKGVNHLTAVRINEHVMHVQVFGADSSHVVGQVIGAWLALREACAVHDELDLTRFVRPN